MLYYEKAVHITILYPAIESTEAKKLLNFGGNIIAADHGKVEYNTVEYTTVFVHSMAWYKRWYTRIEDIRYLVHSNR